MTTNELKAAAEREKVEHIRLNMHTRKKWNLGDFRDFYQRDVEHLLSMADAYLARLAADEQQARDDAEPITEEWLRSHGVIIRDDQYALAVCKDHVTTVIDKGTKDCITRFPCFERYRLGSMECTTRGQLRRLLESLKGGGS